MSLPLPSFQQLTLPDLWQQDAVRALRAGNDVVVDAPTGAGKTFVFELLHRSLRGQSIYTVPTRALANDKLREWRAKNWQVGICTGDVVEDLDAKVVVATLETQKIKFLRREGPSILVIDEYQLIGDANRGVSYELSVALAPEKTQLLLLSGSVANPNVRPCTAETAITLITQRCRGSVRRSAPDQQRGSSVASESGPCG